MPTENFRYFMELTLHPMGLLIAVGLVHILVKELALTRQLFYDAAHGNFMFSKATAGYMPRLLYLLGGILVTACAYMIAQIIFKQFPEIPYGSDQLNFLGRDEMYYSTGYVLSVAMFVLSGYSLIVSAGSRWLVGLAKVFAVIAVLILFAITAGAYLPIDPELYK
jgi:hypothetical protein